MIAGGQDVREAGQVADFFHSAITIRQLKEVEICVGHHHVLCLATGPITHVDIAVSTTWTGRIDAQAHASVHLFAGAASATGHVEGYRYQIADF
ncbi:hypothetical protein D3C80_1842660 [compost metagenome]